jgi:nucleoside-diphosphate-sugar epimerase
MIFILGGKGLVGSAFARFCERAGREYAVVDREEYDNYKGNPCEILVNANGNSSKPLARQAPLQEFDASVRSVRAALTEFPCGHYIHISSCDVYEDCSSPATTQEDTAVDPARQSAYGFHKYLAEQCVRHAARRWTIVRCGGFVGPGLRKNAIFDLLHGGPLWLSPASQLQFLHTDRAAPIIMELAEKAPPNRIYNVCGKGVIEIEEVIRTFGLAVTVQPGSPTVRYEVSIERALQYVDVPESRPAVLDFVRSELGGR